MENMYLKVNGKILDVSLADNSSAKALVEKLKSGDITVRVNDYGDMEKVGSLGFSLPKNDNPTNTRLGDLILYLGNNFVIYYDSNSWNFTRLGRVEGVSSRKEMLDFLGGKGSVDITLSLNK